MQEDEKSRNFKRTNNYQEVCSMIPFIRSLSELMAITHSRDQHDKSLAKISLKNLPEIKKKRQASIDSENKKIIELPALPCTKRIKWIKRKEAVSRFFDELDYNNQIQSSYDLTLQARQSNTNHKDVA